MSRYSTRRSDHIEYCMWLAFNADGDVRMSRGMPSLAPGERALALTARLPLALFKTPQLSATLTVSAPEGTQPAIDVTAAEAALSQAIGCDVVLSVREPE